MRGADGTDRAAASENFGDLGIRVDANPGMFQTVFDVLKLLTKEDITPRAVDKALFFLAPVIVFVPSLMAYMVLPFSRTWVVIDMPYGLLFIFAVMSIVPLGILCAGWASNNKWSLIGAMRIVGSQVTYEVPMLLAALPVVMMAGTRPYATMAPLIMPITAPMPIARATTTSGLRSGCWPMSVPMV